ncbi:MAG: tripartite tricarboxylate transporter substrate binding protein [Burkholderiales bacterium]|nr:tripartite tricarboxylate transporter substrate binding protein [Burkholderiales bacterium]
MKMKSFSLSLVCRCFAGALALTMVAPTSAQQWPSKPIRLIVPFPPGQGADVLGRLVADGLSRALNTPVIVENRVGAGGSVGTEIAAKAAPDGYTLLVAGSGPIAISQSLYPKLGYNTLRDLAPISNLVLLPLIFCVNPASPIMGIADLTKLAKAEPDKITYGSSGSGSVAHLTMAVFESMAGIKLVHVPYKGSIPVITDLIGGQIAVLTETTPAVYSFIKSGKIRAIGVSTAKRIPLLPDVPTLAEQGITGYDVTAWAGLFAPAGTPDAILDRLNAEVVKIFKTPELQKRAQDLVMIPVADSREQFTAYIKSELVNWDKAVKVSGATAE